MAHRSLVGVNFVGEKYEGPHRTQGLCGWRQVVGGWVGNSKPRQPATFGLLGLPDAPSSFIFFVVGSAVTQIR